jgi:Methyltransferase domain
MVTRTSKKMVAWTLVMALILMAVAHITRGSRGQETRQAMIVHDQVSKAKIVCEKDIIYRQAGLPPLKKRDGLAALLESHGLNSGAEVGVQTGIHSQMLLHSWKSCTQFYLIDLWKQQENYADVANRNDQEQEQIFEQAQKAVSAFQNKTIFLRMTSLEAAQQIPDHSLDFVYIDARHDYCGVKEDLNAYWPKLRPGGILAGCVCDFGFASCQTNT